MAMTISTRSMTVFNDNKNALEASVRTFQSWNDDMPIILQIAHNMGLRYDQYDYSPMGNFSRAFYQWVRSKNPLVNGQLFNGIRLADITFVAFRDFNNITFEVYKK